MSFIHYLEQFGVYLIDCSGKVDLELGISRLKALEAELASRPLLSGRRKLLIDFRNTIWASEETHQELSKITRRDFGLHADNPAIRAAILNQRWSGPISDNEHWFFDEGEALEWLTLE
jgi:hypothetical protein